MHYYLAPMEGITGYIYRSAYFDFFHNIDKYFTPFITPHEKRSFNKKEWNDLLPEHNYGRVTIPQILTNRAEDFIRISKELGELGYEEINLNLGCPSGTVVSKGRGAGFLGMKDELNGFFEEVFLKVDVRVSVKTRIGVESPEEFPALLDIFNQYPICELIVHPRVRRDQYRNVPNLTSFRMAAEYSVNPVVYNGDLFTVADFKQFSEEFPTVDTIMMGRGILANPCLIDEIEGRGTLTKEILHRFHDRLYEDYAREMSGERNLLFKMKELWVYMVQMFTNYEKYWKKIRKADHLTDYEIAVRLLFAEQEINPAARWHI